MSQDYDLETLYEGQLTTSAVKVYTVPENEQVEVLSIELVNITGTTATARVDRVPSGSSDGTTFEVYNGSVAPNSSVEAISEALSLEAGDELYVLAGTATAIDCTISGKQTNA